MAFPGQKEMGLDCPPPTDTLPISITAQHHLGAEDLAKHEENRGALGPPPGWGMRHTVALMSCLGIAITYTMRINLSVAIVAMVGTRPSNGTDEPTKVCPLPDDDSQQEVTIGDFAWDETTQGMILGSFYYGYAVSHFPAGRAAEYFGCRLVFGLSILISSILTVLMPFCASLSTELFVALKVLQGLALGGSYPAVNTILTSWYPPADRARYTTFVMSGNYLGTVVTMPLTGWLCSLDALGGWPLAFYTFGLMGAVWCVAWFFLVTDRPEYHPRISSSELRYLKTGQQFMKESEVMPIPVREIVTSPQIWLVTLRSIGDSYGYYILLTELPTYLARIQHFDINKTGFLSALPYLISWLLSLFWGVLVGWLASGIMKLQNIRRLSEGSAGYLPSLALLAMFFVDCNTTLVVVILCVAVGFSSVNVAGYLSSHQDIAPNFAGSLLGITNTFGSFMGVVSPAITGAITNNNQSLTAWHIVFMTSVVANSLTCTLYLMFTPANVQPWNHPLPKTQEEQDNAPGREDLKF